MQTMTRQEVIDEYLIVAEGILSIYRGKNINQIYTRLLSDLRDALEPYRDSTINLLELKRINLEIVQKLYDAESDLAAQLWTNK